MRSPAEYYVKYLILCRYTDLRINRLLDNLGYPRLRPQYVSELRQGPRPPRPFRPTGEHDRTNRWLKRQQLYPAFCRDEHMDDATTALSDSKIRHLLESLILSDMSTEMVIKLVRMRTGRGLSEETVRYYKHFFWNRDVLTAEEWDSFLETYPRGQELTGLYREGSDMAQWRLGFVRQIDPTDMLKTIQSESFHRFMQTHNMPNSSNTARIAATWAGVMFEAHKQLNDGDTRLGDVVARFEQLCMRNVADGVPSIEALAGTLYSKREQPKLIEAEVTDADNRTTRIEEDVDA